MPVYICAPYVFFFFSGPSHAQNCPSVSSYVSTSVVIMKGAQKPIFLLFACISIFLALSGWLMLLLLWSGFFSLSLSLSVCVSRLELKWILIKNTILWLRRELFSLPLSCGFSIAWILTLFSDRPWLLILINPWPIMKTEKQLYNGINKGVKRYDYIFLTHNFMIWSLTFCFI